jgi:hypothetical protein
MPVKLVSTIEEMLSVTPRRHKLVDSEWNALSRPSKDTDWHIGFPFCETYKLAFERACGKYAKFEARQKPKQCWTFLKSNPFIDDAPKEVEAWINTVSRYVVMRDCLDLSFALDFDRLAGNPESDHSEAGDLRVSAKPYDQEATDSHRAAADSIAEKIASSIADLKCFGRIDCVTCCPPSNPDKTFCLSTYLCDSVANKLSAESLSNAIKTTKARQPLKSLSMGQKLETLSQSTEFDKDAFSGKSVLIVDDLYQSGITINFVGLKLRELNAESVYGFCAVKTCTNTDNKGG